jgi:hypothetical protein
MPQKIFISYRRQDSAANVLGIAQYLEHEFGRKNVFVDVDMRAGANFPSVLEQRLAECKVMLVLIGPDWINARDERGQRRLDDPDDWVRLEIAHALKRNISVIPVRIEGAALPSKGMLPDEIRGLLDHQTASVTLAGFRHEMSGLVRDIRSIPGPRPWKRYAALAAGLILLGGAVVLAPALLERFRSPAPTPPSEMTDQNGVWKSNPGEWVMYAVDQNPEAYFYKPSSVKVFGDDAAYTARYPLKSSVGTSSDQASTQGVYEDNLTVVDCKKSTSLLAEWTIYNKSGDSIAHFKRGDPQALDMSAGDPVQPGSILSIGQRIVCDKQMSTPLLSEQQLVGMNSADQLAKRPPKTISTLLGLEGRAALAYFNSWQSLPIRWKGLSRHPIPRDWHVVGQRGTFARKKVGNRNASHPFHAILNYAYAILETQVRIQVIAAGFDSTIGFLHSGRRGRADFVLDLMEPMRPIVDRKVLEFIQAHSFHPADFTIRSDGVCRLNPEMAKNIVQCINVETTAAAPDLQKASEPFRRLLA